MGRAEGIGGPGWELLEILDAWPWARGRLDAVLLLFRRQRAELPQQMLPLGVQDDIYYYLDPPGGARHGQPGAALRRHGFRPHL